MRRTSSSSIPLGVAVVAAVLLLGCCLAGRGTMGFQTAIVAPSVTTRSLPGIARAQHQQPQRRQLRSSSPPPPASAAPPLLRMVSYEDLAERIPAQTVIDAVQNKARESSINKVTASDVAAEAGVSLSQARRDLTALASLSQGDIAVTADGDLLYGFPSDLKGALAQNSAKYQSLQAFRKAWPAVFWGIRVTFGAALLASIVAIFSTIFFLQTAASSSDDRDNRGGGGRRSGGSFGGGGGFGGMGYNPWFGPSPFDVFYYRPYGSYGAYGRREANRDPDEMGFLESVFSYIFGDGNPNGTVEERRLQLASAMIRASAGAVTAEQLAPFCDDVPAPVSGGESESAYVDEAFVLPIVTALDGEPQVTEEGEIVYVFPELQVSAGGGAGAYSAASAKSLAAVAAAKEGAVLRRAGLKSGASAAEIKQLLDYNRINRRGALERSDLIGILERVLPPPTDTQEAELMDSDPTVLQEKEWKFSLAPDLNKYLAGGLGVLNLGGALYLGNMLSQYALYGVQLPAFYGVVQTFYPLLLGYALLFNIIPVVRNFWIQQENQKIARRNQERRKWQTELASVGRNGRTRLGKKLQAAMRWGKKIRRLGASKDDIIFDTSQPFEKTQVQKDEQKLQDFDKLLEQDEGSFE